MFCDFHFLCKLKKEITDSGCKTLLDLGCGKESPIKPFAKDLDYSLGVDSFEPYLDSSLSAKIHTEYRVGDVMEVCRSIEDKSFDCVIALDFIEHLPKEKGYDLISEMERIAKKKIIIYTPNGFLEQSSFDSNSMQEHLSGWSADEMRKQGMRIFGMSGFKFIRGPMGAIKRKPVVFWRFASSLSQMIAYFFARTAFQILCIKDMEQNYE